MLAFRSRQPVTHLESPLPCPCAPPKLPLNPANPAQRSFLPFITYREVSAHLLEFVLLLKVLLLGPTGPADSQEKLWDKAMPASY
jgi:hypothetical protein